MSCQAGCAPRTPLCKDKESKCAPTCHFITALTATPSPSQNSNYPGREILGENEKVQLLRAGQPRLQELRLSSVQSIHIFQAWHAHPHCSNPAPRHQHSMLSIPLGLPWIKCMQRLNGHQLRLNEPGPSPFPPPEVPSRGGRPTGRRAVGVAQSHFNA